MVTVEDFSSVMEQLGVYLSGQETEHLKRLFDRRESSEARLETREYQNLRSSTMARGFGRAAYAVQVNHRFVLLLCEGDERRLRLIRRRKPLRFPQTIVVRT